MLQNQSESDWVGELLGVRWALVLVLLRPYSQSGHSVLPECCGHLPTAQAVAEYQNVEEGEIMERIPKEVIKQLPVA